MGLFDMFKKKSTAGSVESSSESVERTANNAVGITDGADKAKVMADIFKTICKKKENIAAEIAECTGSPEEYYAKNAELFSERGISADDTDEVMWLGCVDILIKNAYAVELDHSCGLEDFVSGVEGLEPYSSKKIVVYEIDFSADADINTWIFEMNETLMEHDLCVCAIDIDSDSYVIFLTDIETLDRLEDKAKRIGHRIELAYYM